MDDKEREEILNELSNHNYNVTDLSDAGDDKVFVQNTTTYEGTIADLKEVEGKGAEQVWKEAF